MARHYERIIAACCFLFLFVDIGLPSTSFSVFQPSIVAAPGVGDAGGSFVLCARSLASMIAMLFVNAYLRRFDVRVGVFLACLLTSAGFFVYSVAASLPVFICGALLAGTGYGLGGMVGMTVLLSRWYKDRVSTAIGVATVGSGVASIVMPVIAVQLIHNVSLHAAFAFEATVALVVGVLVFVFLRTRPSDIGAQPYEQRSKVLDAPGKRIEKSRKREPHEDDLPVPRTVQVLLLAAVACLGAVALGGMSYLSVLMTTEGFDPIFAGSMISLCGAALTVSKFVTGEIFDHAGPRHGTTLLFAILVLGLALCALAPLRNVPVMVCGVVLMGFGSSIATVGISVWSLELSDAEHRARTVKNFQISYAAGGFLFNLLPGSLKELTGSYDITYVILVVLVLFGAAVIIGSYWRYRRGLG